MSKSLQDLEIELGILRNRVIEGHASIAVLLDVIVAMNSRLTGIEQEVVKEFIKDRINEVVLEIQTNQA